MPYLVVLGDASWTRGNRRYGAGVHEIDDLTAAAARLSGITSLVVTRDEPTIAQKKPGPLSADDVKLGVRGVRLENIVENLPPAEPGDLPRDYICEWCDAEFPSAGARKRHVELHHDLKSHG